MEVTFSVPDPLFAPGDVVEQKNTENEKSIVFLITDYKADGEFYVYGERVEVEVLHAHYVTYTMEGSYGRNTEATRLRTGICTVPRADELEATGVKIGQNTEALAYYCSAEYDATSQKLDPISFEGEHSITQYP